MLEVMCGVKCGDWLSTYLISLPNHPFFGALLQKNPSSHCVIGWVFPILWSLGCCIAFIANLWILWGSTFFVVLIVKKSQICIIFYKKHLWSLQKMQNFISCDNKFMSFHLLICSFCVVNSTLCYQLMMFTHWQMLSLSIPFE
jgi:hypothetical protein